ncbi:hypothetical protein J4E83_009134 [Alternaria metachromatica]|uniref:uncharacterized protein n=1 Tax=Alternaria metachromatica TaxID=283354 RepID=UPI0020C384B7|nr:uncharacterized protein J4E83_009134 [Alternaria metachromatica]KAI4608332.1 hypothetical protein J4E83_009134 [Alternaria metachromatica]
MLVSLEQEADDGDGDGDGDGKPKFGDAVPASLKEPRNSYSFHSYAASISLKSFSQLPLLGQDRSARLLHDLRRNVLVSAKPHVFVLMSCVEISASGQLLVVSKRILLLVNSVKAAAKLGIRALIGKAAVLCTTASVATTPSFNVIRQSHAVFLEGTGRASNAEIAGFFSHFWDACLRMFIGSVNQLGPAAFGQNNENPFAKQLTLSTPLRWAAADLEMKELNQTSRFKNSALLENFSSLPAEMKTNIFASVRDKATNAAVRLVNHEWRDIITPMAFSNLTIASNNITPEMLNTILEPGNGVIPHVKSIYIARVGTEKLYGACDYSTQMLLMAIINELPKEALCALAGEVNLPTGILLHLLQHQTKLKRLDVLFNLGLGTSNVSYAHGAHKSWISSRLASIESLTVMPDDMGSEQCKAAELLVRSAPNLKELRIVTRPGCLSLMAYPDRPDARPDWTVFGGPFESGSAPPRLKLSRMSLEQVVLERRAAALMQGNVDLSKLKCLQLVDCESIVDLMTVLAPVCNLTELNITMARNSSPLEYTIRAVEALLNPFNSLEKLWLDMADGRLVDVSCIVRHTSLRQLGIDGQITDRVPFYPPKDLEKILKSLPYLEGLAVHFPRQSLHPIRDPNPLSYLVPDRPGSDMVFDQKTYLTHIATHPHLKHLRLLSPPDIHYTRDNFPPHREPDAFGFAVLDEMVMQHYTAQMLYHLSSSGSRVQVLGISPGASHIVEKTGLEDGNGHSWPEYWYRKGRDCGDGESGSLEMMAAKEPVKEGGGDVLGKLKEVAVPMKIGPGVLLNTVFKQMFDVGGGLRGPP